MKAGTLDKVKCVELQHALGMARWQVCGILQCLWFVTSDNAPQGDIGKFTDDAIADAMGMDRELFSRVLEALIACRWVDRSAKHRLVIHDWSDHCEQYVKRRLERMKLLFVEAGPPQWLAGMTSQDGQSGRLVKKSDLPCPAQPLKKSHPPSVRNTPAPPAPAAVSPDAPDGQIGLVGHLSDGGLTSTINPAQPEPTAKASESNMATPTSPSQTLRLSDDPDEWAEWRKIWRWSPLSWSPEAKAAHAEMVAKERSRLPEAEQEEIRVRLAELRAQLEAGRAAREAHKTGGPA